MKVFLFIEKLLLKVPSVMRSLPWFVYFMLQLLSHFSHVWLCGTPWTIARQVFCPWDFPGKSTGVGCHALLQRDLPNPEIELRSPALQADSTILATWEAHIYHFQIHYFAIFICDLRCTHFSIWAALRFTAHKSAYFIGRN